MKRPTYKCHKCCLLSRAHTQQKNTLLFCELNAFEYNVVLNTIHSGFVDFKRRVLAHNTNNMYTAHGARHSTHSLTLIQQHSPHSHKHATYSHSFTHTVHIRKYLRETTTTTMMTNERTATTTVTATAMATATATTGNGQTTIQLYYSLTHTRIRIRRDRRFHSNQHSNLKYAVD